MTAENLKIHPDYQLRRFYKIDWKVCFIKWAFSNKKLASYFVFVEDDSFMCTGNLLYQLSLLHNLPNQKEKHSFITGTRMVGVI